MSPPTAPNLYVSGIAWNRESVLALLPLIDCTPDNGCSRCCREEVAFIRVQDHEIERIAAHLHRSVKRLRRKWSRRDGVWGISPPCEFLCREGGCGIWQARPVVCKYFPLAMLQHEGHQVVGVTTQWCEAGRPCIEQLRQWERDGGSP